MIDVGSIEDMREGKPLVVRVKGREIALVRWRDEVFAVRNICPHQSEAFTAGHTRPELAGTSPGDVAANFDDPVLVCPLHKWTYKLRTGQCAVDSQLRVRTYPVAITGDGRVLVDADARKK